MSFEDTLRSEPAFNARFEIGRKLGEGGMGAVYFAHDTIKERDVAIKVALHEGEAGEVDQRVRKLWVNEMRLAGRLKHPHIVELHEAGQNDRFSYLVMELVDGTSLKDHVRHDTLLPIDRVVDVIYKVARALEYANTNGLLHRDIKPANVLLTADGTPKISDFGSCFFITSDETQVMDVGTLPFVAPEQLRGEAPGIQSDLYAVGIMAYQLLCGSWPFTDGSQASMIYQKVHQDPIALEVKRADVPEALRSVVHRAMHRDPARRYAGWRPLCEDLAALLPGIARDPALQTDSARYEGFRNQRFFAPFAETDLWESVRIAKPWRLAPGDALFTEGEAGHEVFIVLEGDLDIRRKGVPLALVHAGECVGELAFVEEPNHIRSATATALVPCLVEAFDATAVNNATGTLQAALQRAIMKSLVERLRKADARYISAVVGRSGAPEGAPG